MTSKKIILSKLAHVHYQHRSLSRALEFLQDFGMEIERSDGNTVYLRGYGEQPYVYVASQSPDGKRHFLGATWVVSSLEDLQTAANHPNALSGGIREATGPGGGRTVTLVDPLGNAVHFIHGQTLNRASQSPTTGSLEPNPTPSNQSLLKPRQGAFRRFQSGPSPVHKLGHYGYVVPAASFDSTLSWYLNTFNLARSDTIFSPATGQDETCFTHIDLGETFSDHHAFFLGAHPTSEVAYIHHASFETNDFDTQLLGHHYLRARKWTNCWGVGRHVLGSQVFDYWFDASGNVLEHYSDGDLVNCRTEPKREAASPDSLPTWGPNVPLAFLTGRVEDASIDAPMPTPGPVAVAAGGVNGDAVSVGAA